MLQILGGAELWHYTSPTAKLSDCEAEISSGIQTLDGGYLYLTRGDVYNAGKGLSIDLAAKTKIIKLDTARHKTWEIVVDKYYSGFGISQAMLLESADSTFMLIGSIATDSTAPNFIDGRFYLSKYGQNGTFIYRHALTPSLDANDTVKYPRGGHFDFYQTSDKGFMLCGLYYNSAAIAPATVYRGWLMKLDSNGCLGAGDTNCFPLNIATQKVSNQMDFKVYPNPSNGNFNITSLTKHSINATIFDLLGRTILQTKIQFHNNESSLNIDAQKGIYILELQDEIGNRWRERIVVE